MSIKVETYIVDSFTPQPFKGNPAGVCIPKEKMPDDIMFAIAKELNLSETAFLEKTERSNYYSIRYFSPKMEISLCGHATLAAAKVMFKNHAELDAIHFKTIEGLDLKVTKSETYLAMEFPIYETTPINVPKEMLAALGLKAIVNSAYNKEINSILIEIEDSELLSNLKPNFERLVTTHNTIDGVVVTALSKDPEYTFQSRYFWPWSGSNEDPVTGATHTFLAKYWGDKLNKTKMTAFQCSKRSGVLELELKGEILQIRGEAQIILTGHIQL